MGWRADEAYDRAGREKTGRSVSESIAIGIIFVLMTLLLAIWCMR